MAYPYNFCNRSNAFDDFPCSRTSAKALVEMSNLRRDLALSTLSIGISSTTDDESPFFFIANHRMLCLQNFAYGNGYILVCSFDFFIRRCFSTLLVAAGLFSLVLYFNRRRYSIHRYEREKTMSSMCEKKITDHSTTTTTIIANNNINESASFLAIIAE